MRGDRAVSGLVVLGLGMAACSTGAEEPVPAGPQPAPGMPEATVILPAPRSAGAMSLEEALANRRSIREFTDEPLELEEVSQLLWAAQGVTAEWGGRTAPSAGALYPLETYVVLPEGLYRYLPQDHRMETRSSADLRGQLADAALGQMAVSDAAAVFVITAVFARTAAKYGGRAERYVHLEAGHAAQNILLQSVALDLGGVPIGAFDDEDVQRVLDLPRDHAPLYLVPVGHPAVGVG